MSKERRTYSAQFKLETVLEGRRGDKSVAQICRERGSRTACTTRMPSNSDDRMNEFSDPLLLTGYI
jgi:hypothetical protein